jgi:hypothetical protein
MRCSKAERCCNVCRILCRSDFQSIYVARITPPLATAGASGSLCRVEFA